MSDYQINSYLKISDLKKVTRNNKFAGLIKAIAKMPSDQAMQVDLKPGSKSSLYKALQEAFPSTKYTISNIDGKFYIYRRQV